MVLELKWDVTGTVSHFGRSVVLEPKWDATGMGTNIAHPLKWEDVSRGPATNPVVVSKHTKYGDVRPFVASREADGVALVAANIANDTVARADEASHWDSLHARLATKRINHNEATRWAELAPIRSSRSSRAFAGLRSALTTSPESVLAAYASEMA